MYIDKSTIYFHNGKQICWKKRVACLTQAVAAILEFLLARKMHILSRTIQLTFPLLTQLIQRKILNSFSQWPFYICPVVVAILDS